VAVCAVAAHQATYLLGFGAEGYGEAVGAGGHDGYWAPLVVLVLLAGAGLAAVTIRELRRLTASAAHLQASWHPGRELRSFAWGTGALWLRLVLATTIVYVIQENIERVLVGQTPSGIDALTVHGLLPVLVILVTSLTVAIVAALARWHCEALLARLARRTQDTRRRRPQSLRPAMTTRLPRHSTPAARGSRAPPVVALTV
jgi:hypothetical protein